MIKISHLALLLAFVFFLNPGIIMGQGQKTGPKAASTESCKTGTAKGVGIRRIIAPEQMTPLDHVMLEFAKAAAQECSHALEAAIDKRIKSEEEIFSTLYFPLIPVTSPPKFSTFYDDYTDRAITPIEDRYLERDDRIVFVVLVDRNGYLPSHNTRFSQSMTGDRDTDLKRNRTKRIFNDVTGFCAAKNRGEFLLQQYRRDTGELIADISVPVFVKERHWGALRIGFIVGEGDV